MACDEGEASGGRTCAAMFKVIRWRSLSRALNGDGESRSAQSLGQHPCAGACAACGVAVS